MSVFAALGASFFVALGIALSTQLRNRPIGVALGTVPIALAIFIIVASLWTFSMSHWAAPIETRQSFRRVHCTSGQQPQELGQLRAPNGRAAAAKAERQQARAALSALRQAMAMLKWTPRLHLRSAKPWANSRLAPSRSFKVPALRRHVWPSRW
jgi:hypothetical protein